MNNINAARACLVLVGQLHRAGLHILAASAINGQPFVKLDRPAGLRAHHAAVDRIGRRQLVAARTHVNGICIEWNI